jgi:hypothetical protein
MLMAGAFLVGCGPEDIATEDSDVVSEAEAIRVECLAFKEEHVDDEVFGGALEVDCADSFHHYASTVQTTNPAAGQSIRIANFNVYHLGDDQGRYKRYDTLADMIDQWDVVSAVELMTPNGETVRHNSVVRAQAEAGQVDERVKVIIPGYLELLKSLMRKDPSWSLVMTPIPLQEPGASHAELTGFYYRKSRVKLVDTALCGEAACVSSVEALQKANGLSADQQPQIARRPFAAGFKSGKFDFSLVGVHIRFRAPEQGTAPFQGVDRLTAFRLLETQIVANWIGHELRDSADKDVIFAGDFNIEFTKMDTVGTFTPGGQPREEVTYEEAWDKALTGFEGAEVFVTREATSLSTSKLVSNFDHLIYSPSLTKECIIPEQEAHAFNFTDAEVLPSYAELRSGAGIDKYAEEFIERQAACHTFKGGGRVKRVEPCLAEGALQDISDKIKEIAEEAKRGDFSVHTPLVSDHIPVVVECKLPTSDDD